MTVKCALAIAGATLDPAEDHLVADGTMEDVVREVIRDVRLELHHGVSRKGVSPLPIHNNLNVSSVSGRINTIIGVWTCSCVTTLGQRKCPICAPRGIQGWQNLT